MTMKPEVAAEIISKLAGDDKVIFHFINGRFRSFYFSDALNTLTEDGRMADVYGAVLEDFLRTVGWKYR